MERIGILGGTFDPPHMGHLILAEYTRERLQLDHVLFVPVGNHPHKDQTRIEVNHRLAMLTLAVADNEAFTISDVDLHRPGPHYSADTVQLIQEDYPAAELFFVMGGDNWRSLPTWKRADDLYRHAQLAVMKRADEDISPDMHNDIFPGIEKRVRIIDTPLLSIWLSSTHVVDRIRDGLSVRYLVPDAVLNYIEKHDIYQPE